jgi:peptide-methionine (S)-S-oxide reductase
MHLTHLIGSRATRRLLIGFGAATLLAGSFAMRAGASEINVRLPAPQADIQESSQRAKAVFAGGCFWGVQGVFQRIKGVERAVSGYAGGTRESADYEKVSTGRTGHAEAVEVTYDPRQVTFGQLMQAFFSVALDPTQVNRQGPDSGPQYRSEIFATTPQQAEAASAYIAQLDAGQMFKRPIATKVTTGAAFHAAEAYHQDYLLNHPSQPYIAYNDIPKVENLKRLFPDLWRAEPVRVASGS